MSEILEEFREELPGILNWAVCGAVFWHNGGLELPEPVKQATEEYKTEMDLITQFIDARCEMRADYAIKKAILFQAWQNWTNDEGEHDAGKRGKRWFTTQLQNRGIESGGHGDGDYKGIRLAGDGG